MKAAPRAEPKPPKRYTLVRVVDVIARPIDWIWKHHLARGRLELMTGLPGMAKSQVHCSHAASITTTKRWPDGANWQAPGSVIMLTAEDNTEQVVKPRLMAAGADCSRIYILAKIRKDNRDRMFLLAEDLEDLAMAIEEVGDVVLVTVDPITAYLGAGRGFDSHRTTDVRNQLGPLAEMAERCNVAFSANTHPSKNAGPRAIDWFIGSQAFIAAARMGHVCVEEMEDDGAGGRKPTGRLLYTSVRKNLVPNRVPAIAYTTEMVWPEPGIEASRVVWAETIDTTADEAIAAAKPGKPPQGSDVVTFLLDILANGPVPKKVIEERATKRGFSEMQLRTAKQKMGIVVYKDGMTGGWVWALPQDAPKEE